jgi:SAM-dependent methyltransferase
MVHNNDEVLKYWEQYDVESMYDKFLINAEINLIKSLLTPGSRILDAGCGEGEGTLQYADVPNVVIHAVDFSETRLKKAKETTQNTNNIIFKKVDFLNDYTLDSDFDTIISQRFLINLMEWKLQKKVINDLMNHLKPGGKLLMFEGSEEGTSELNALRELFGLPPIPVKWHNLFFNDKKLSDFILSQGHEICDIYGLGEYFFLTRGIRPYFDKNLNWDSEFNKISTDGETRNLLNFNTKFSRLKLWVIKK